MNILLLNLTRFGDLLQTQAAITDLSQRGHRVGIVCLDNFLEAAGLLRHVSHVEGLGGASLLSAVLDADKKAGLEPEGSRGWIKAFADLALWKESLVSAFPFDLVCNLTPTISARLLARFIAGNTSCSGFAVDGHGFGYTGNGWAAFMQGASAARGVSPFNVVDIFRMVSRPQKEHAAILPGNADLQKPQPSEQDAVAHSLKSRAPKGCAGFVALQLGASEDRRRWPVENFAALGRRLWEEEKLCPVLLGSRAEKNLAERYRALSSHPYIDVCGETSLAELASVLCSVRLLITNDTGTMHLAAGLDTPVLSIFLATAQPFDTGPYRQGSCAIEPDMPCHPCPFGTKCPYELACRKKISVELVCSLAKEFLQTKMWARNYEGQGGRVWVSEYDSQGFMGLRSLSGHGTQARTEWLRLLRHALRQFIDNGDSLSFSLSRLEPPLAVAIEDKEALMADVERAKNLVMLLREQGKVLQANPLPTMKNKFLSTWDMVCTVLSQSRTLAALSILWLEQTQASGQDFPRTLAVAENFQILLEGLLLELFPR